MKMGKKRAHSGDEDPLQSIKQLYSSEVPQGVGPVVVEQSDVVVPQSQGTQVAESLSTPVAEDQSATPEETQSTTVPQSSDIPPVELHGGKRPGWKQMTIWVQEDMEPAMKLLSQFEGASISEMVRIFFQQRIEASPYRDLIREVMRKKAKIRKNQ